MRYSVTYPLITHPYHPDFLSRDALTRFCQTAEKAGFDGIGFTDHPAPTEKWLRSGGHDALDPFVALSFCAAVTERIRLIPNIVVLPYRHPLIVAKMVATLDALSEGRFTLAVATGYLRGEYKALGVEFEQRNALFDQAIEVLRGIWSADGFSYDGIGIAAAGLAANPKPVPHPPIWIGGNSRMSRRRVATIGDGWTPFPAPRIMSQTTKTPPLETVEDLSRMLDELWQFVDEAGRDRADIDVAFGTREGGAPGSDHFDPAAHREGLEGLVALGVTWGHTSVPGDSLAHALEALEQYGETVIAPNVGVTNHTVGRLEGRAAIVTGGGGGIGGATARTLAREGASVLVADIDQSAAERVVSDIAAAEGVARAWQGDLSVAAQAEAAVGAAVAAFGRLDVLHNNAALTDSEALTLDTTVTDLDLDTWERAMAVNLRSQMLMCRYAIPEMVKEGGGSIINMSSGASLKGDRTRTAYGVSKAGVNVLSMYVATSHGKQGIRVNTIVPGLIITDAVKAHLTEKMVAGLGRATLTPYVGAPQDVADLVLFLASDESRYITGQMLAIDGGMSAHVGLTDG